MNIIEKFKQYFEPDELVSRVHYQTFINKDDVYGLFNPKLIETILVLRLLIDKPFTINDWSYSKAKKVYNYRGYRWTDCKEGASLSQHKKGNAFDFVVKGMTAKEVRQFIKANKNKLPYPIRVENVGNWVHIDLANTSSEKVYFFKP